MGDSSGKVNGPQEVDIHTVVSGGVWRTTPVSSTPQLVLTDWRVYAVPLLCDIGTTCHFVGWNQTEGEGRVSSPIVEFDLKTMRGRTQTGRVYELQGKSGWNSDAGYVWDNWKRLHGITDEHEVVDMSAEILKWARSL